MTDDVKLVHFTIIDGNEEDIKALAEELKKFKNKKYQFLITNEVVELTSVKYLIDELYRLYKKMKEEKKDE